MKDIFELSIDELKNSPELQRQVFQLMLLALEDNGRCRHVYHRLAFVLVDLELE